MLDDQGSHDDQQKVLLKKHGKGVNTPDTHNKSLVNVSDDAKFGQTMDFEEDNSEGNVRHSRKSSQLSNSASQLKQQLKTASFATRQKFGVPDDEDEIKDPDIIAKIVDKTPNTKRRIIHEE